MPRNKTKKEIAAEAKTPVKEDAKAPKKPVKVEPPKKVEEEVKEAPRGSKDPKKGAFLLLSGRHRDEKGEKYSKGDIVYSDRNLEEVYKNKFRKQ